MGKGKIRPNIGTRIKFDNFIGTPQPEADNWTGEVICKIGKPGCKFFQVRRDFDGKTQICSNKNIVEVL